MARTSTVTVAPESTDALSFRAVGVAAAGGAVTVIVTVAVPVAPLPSVRVYVNESVPTKPELGV